MSFMTAMHMDEESYRHEKQHENNDIQRLAISHDRSPVLAQIVADHHQEAVPHRRSDDGIDGEFHLVHPGDPRGERNEMTDHGDEPADEDRDGAVLLEETMGELEIVPADEEEFPVPIEERFSSIHPDIIGDEGTDDAAQCANEHNASERECPLSDKKSREWHDSFARDRKDHALHHHEDEDAQIACACDECGDILR